MSFRKRFFEKFHAEPTFVFSAPGRTELGGNHTDHQHGLVLAAAVNVDTKAAVALNGTSRIRVQSEGYPYFELSTDDLAVRAGEQGSTAALVRGVTARFVQLGGKIQGFDAYICSDVLPGSGLSSSASFEVLFGCLLNHLFPLGLSPVEIAQIGQYAENVYFGKPCGLMDQTASAIGGILGMDFADPATPQIVKIPFDFSASGHTLCIIDSGADHANLTAEYAAIPEELRAVCNIFGKSFLRDVPEYDFYARLSEVRKTAGDRAALRAMHVYDENRRVQAQISALQKGDFSAFLRCIRHSGRSSWQHLQNIVPTGHVAHQEIAFALALTEKLLNGQGACRVHGGGFAGTIQAFVPNEHLDSFRNALERILGKGSCRVIAIRTEGCTLLETSQ